MMLASELIKQLQALVDEYGDKPITDAEYFDIQEVVDEGSFYSLDS